jgi:hypothetical protein
MVQTTIVTFELAIYQKRILAMAYTLRVGERVHRLGKGKIVHSIEDICLASTIVAHKAVDIGRESELLLANILEVDD